MKDNKGIKIGLLIAIFILVIILVIVGVIIYLNKNNNEDVKKIVKEKFEMIENMYFEPNDYFDISSEKYNSESKYLINNYEQLLNKYFVSPAKEGFMPYCVLKENDQYFLFNGGGEVSYRSLKSIDIINANDTEIKAKIIVNCADGFENSIDDKSIEMKLVKNGNDWLISNFDIKVFE